MITITMTGNLADDAKITETSNGKYITFRIAHTRRWTGSDNVEHELTQWASCITRGDKEALLPYLVKGQKVLVQGDPSIDVYSSPKEKRWVGRYNINVQHLELCGGSAKRLPQELYTKEGEIVPVHQRLMLVLKDREKFAGVQLLDKNSNEWEVDESGCVHEVKEDTPEL